MSAGPLLNADDRPRINSLYLFRWEPTQDAYVLLYPEGVVKLNPTAGEILKRCTGSTSVRALVADLAALYNADADKVEQGALKFLELAHAKGWIRIES